MTIPYWHISRPSLRNGILGRPGAIVRPSRGHNGFISGPSVAHRWAISGHLEPILSHLGAILKPSWATLRPSCAFVAPSWVHLGAPCSDHELVVVLRAPWWAILWPSWGHRGPSCAILGASWAILGPSWGHVGPAWGSLQRPRIRGCFKGPMRRRYDTFCCIGVGVVETSCA